MEQSIEGVLARVRPCLAVDGGDVELVGIDQGVVTLRIIGGIARCPMSQIALHCGLENALREAIPELSKVILLRA